MNARSHDLRIEHVQRDQVQHGHGHHHQHVHGHGVQWQGREQRGNHGQRQADVGHQAHEPAERTHQHGIGHTQPPKQHRAQHRQQHAQDEVADHEGPHHIGNPLHAARRYQAIFAVEELQEAAVDVVAPTQHEIHQERDEGRHQQHLVDRAQARIDVIADGGAFLKNPDFGNGPRQCRLRHRGGALLALPGREQSLLLLFPALFFLALPRRHQHLVGLVFHGVDLLLDAIHQVADALPVLRQLVVETGQLRIRPHPDDVQKRQREGTHHKARQGAGEAQAHQQRHERFQNEGDSEGDQRGDEEQTPEVQDGNHHTQRQNRQGNVTRLLSGAGGTG